MASAPLNAITAQVKLVIWDLDETFWNGTLSEEGISPIEGHAEMVRTLVDRGIMCSICSKNDFNEAKVALEELGLWDYFVFPHIQWSPKGQAIQNMIARMGLRAENVVFIDDNHLNIEEAHFSNPELMVVDGNTPLLPLLDLPEFRGKEDSAHSRLAQYRMMESKFAEQDETGLSNLDFLRQSDVRVKIIFDIEDQFDRIVELLNRTNQLNFTKNRVHSDQEKEDLRALLATSGIHAGLVHVQDRYGDYGIVGFFCLRLRYSGTNVQHFAFSCRAMNMGIEQWVWEFLNKPDFRVAGPVANGLDHYDEVDWVTRVEDFSASEASSPDRRLCLVGGCDLQQMSFYCGTDRQEFVNKQDDSGRLVRFDDVGFFLNPREEQLKSSLELGQFVGYGLDDMLAFDEALASADIILLSMLHSLTTDNLFTFGDGLFGGRFIATVPPARMKRLMSNPATAGRFARRMYHRPYDLEKRLKLTRRSLDRSAKLSKPESQIFVLSAVTDRGPQAERNRDIRLAYNEMCQSFCDATHNAHFVDIEALLDPQDFSDSDHYTRTGYFKISEFVNRIADQVMRIGKAA